MKKTEDSDIRELTAQLKALEQKEANSPWRSRCQEIVNWGLKSIKKKPGKQYKKNQCNKELVFRENQQDRQTFIQTNEKAGRDHTN